VVACTIAGNRQNWKIQSPCLLYLLFAISKWVKHKVPITHIHHCHLLDYENQIISVVLSHCCYSLRVGEAHTVQYNYEAIEKQIMDKFIYGKPIILVDIPQVVYRKDIYTTVTINAVRKKIKQVSGMLQTMPANYHYTYIGCN